MPEKTIEDWLNEVDINPDDRPRHYDDQYTEPVLRWHLKEAIQASDKGGRSGVWSARKAQLLVKEYERRGGSYLGDKGEKQQSLEDWTSQDWQTAEGSADANEGRHMERYLPADAWALLTEEAREEARASKREADERGETRADWPEAVRRVMTELGYVAGADRMTRDMLYARAQELDIEGRSDMNREELKDAIIQACRHRK